MNQITPGSTPRPDEPQPDLAAAVRRLAHTNVLVIGDVMLDRYTYGDVTRISQEAPVPVLAIEREVALPGGAGNVVRNLTALGAATAFISVVGDDQAGSDLTGLIGGQPNVEPWLLVQGSRTTTLKTRLIAAGQQLLRADREQTDPIHPKLAERLLRIALDAMAATSVTVLSDYGKGVLSGRCARQAGRSRAQDRPQTDRRSPRQRLRPLCRRRRGDAEPPGTRRRDRACRSTPKPRSSPPPSSCARVTASAPSSSPAATTA